MTWPTAGTERRETSSATAPTRPSPLARRRAGRGQPGGQPRGGGRVNSLDGDGVNDTWGEYSFQYGPEIRDLGNETHMEYGSRVGIWRICRLIDQYRIPATFNAVARALERNPQLCDWLRDRDHDVLGHGYHWYGRPGAGMTREQERAEIAMAVESIQRTTGQRIRGWMVRSFPTVHTRELLAEDGGFLYDSDANNDELPYYVTALGRPFLVVPYTKVHNDVRYLIPPTYASPRHFSESLRLDPGLPARGGAGRPRRQADVGRRALALERAAGPRLGAARLHRVRAGMR